MSSGIFLVLLIFIIVFLFIGIIKVGDVFFRNIEVSFGLCFLLVMRISYGLCIESLYVWGGRVIKWFYLIILLLYYFKLDF